MKRTFCLACLIILCGLIATVSPCWSQGITYSISISGMSSVMAAGSQPGFAARENNPYYVHFSIEQTVTGAVGGVPNAYVCVIDASDHCILGASPSVFTFLKANTPYAGQVLALAPHASAAAPVTVALCNGPLSQRAGSITCDKLASATSTVPVYAEYTIFVTSVKISHTRAPHHDSLVLNSIAGTVGRDGSGEPACSQTPSPSCHQALQLGDHNNATVVPKREDFGPFQIVPGNTALYLGYAVLNFGAGYSSDHYNSLANRVTDNLKDLVPLKFPAGDTNLIPDPTPQQQINRLGWKGCDGPVAVDVVGLWDAAQDGSQQKTLHTLTLTDQYVQQSGPYEFRSQIGCGHSPKYTITWKIVRTSLP